VKVAARVRHLARGDQERAIIVAAVEAGDARRAAHQSALDLGGVGNLEHANLDRLLVLDAGRHAHHLS
jgi:hypothetical protein